MIRLKLMNKVKIVDSEHAAKKLVAQGYKITSEPSFIASVTTTPKIETSDSEEGNDDNGRVKCPYCTKDYAEEKNLREHIKSKHSDKLDEYLKTLEK